MQINNSHNKLYKSLVNLAKFYLKNFKFGNHLPWNQWLIKHIMCLLYTIIQIIKLKKPNLMKTTKNDHILWWGWFQTGRRWRRSSSRTRWRPLACGSQLSASPGPCGWTEFRIWIWLSEVIVKEIVMVECYFETM